MGTRLRFEHPWIEETTAPIFLIHLPADRSLTDTEAMWDHIAAVYSRTPDPEPFGWIVITDHSTAAGRRNAVRHVKQVHSYLRAHCVGMATVVTSRVIRGAATAVNWLLEQHNRRDVVIKPVASLEDGFQYLLQLFLQQRAS